LAPLFLEAGLVLGRQKLALLQAGDIAAETAQDEEFGFKFGVRLAVPVVEEAGVMGGEDGD
jgi:hypothetical protein